jgi:hypothetical protein
VTSADTSRSRNLTSTRDICTPALC